MANVPAPKHEIGRGLPGAVRLLEQCSNPWCDNQAEQQHHVVRRSFTGGPFPLVEIYGKVWPNIIGVCSQCHLKLELNQAQIWALEHEHKYLWRDNFVCEFLSPHPVLEDGEPPAGVALLPRAGTGAHGSPSSSTAGGDEEVSPGSTCPQCKRRVPHPRKASSPKTKVYGMRVPLDEAETFGEVVDAAAEHLGVKDQPHYKFKTLSLASALVLQDEGLRDFGRK